MIPTHGSDDYQALHDVTSTDLVQEQTKKRLNDTYKGQQQAKLNERRWNSPSPFSPLSWGCAC